MPGVCSSASESVSDWVRQVELANHLLEIGEFDRAAAVYTQALEHARSAGDDLRAGVVLQNLGRLHDRRGELRAAEKAYLRALAAFQHSNAPDDRLLVRTYASLSTVYIQAGQYSKADTLIRNVLANHPAGAVSDKASLMGSLGVVLGHKQQSGEAENLLRQTADMCANAPDLEMQEAGAVASANLASLQMRGGRTAEALASYRQALTIMEALPNPSPATFVATLADYAKAARNKGDRETAENMYLKSIAIAEARLGPKHVTLGRLLEGYAEVVRDAGRKSEARKLANAGRRIQNEWNRENMTGHTVDVNTLLQRR